ncbi:MAG: hypothetical protein ACFFD2_30675, partial [Promethearchaeota archaeon]
MINNNEIEKSSTTLNKVINEFNDLLLNKNEIFYVSVDQINQEIQDFPKFSSDIKQDWKKKLEDQKSKWNEITSELNKKVDKGKESNKRDELEQKLKANIEDIKVLIENMEEITLELIKKKYLNDAENKISQTYLKISQKIDKYNQNFKDFIKTATAEFKSFRETAEDLIENWEKEKINLIKFLNKTRDKLEEETEKTGSTERKKELQELIKTNLFNLEENIIQLKSHYHQFLQTGKR